MVPFGRDCRNTWMWNVKHGDLRPIRIPRQPTSATRTVLRCAASVALDLALLSRRRSPARLIELVGGVPGQQFLDAADRAIGDPLGPVVEITLRVDWVEALRVTVWGILIIF